MKTLLEWKLGMGVVLLTSWLNASDLFAQDAAIEEAFRDGLYQEEVEDDLEAALSAYKDVTARVGRLRQLGAKALFREASVLRKLERNEEAIARYQALLRQYPEDETLGKLTKEQLIALGVQSADSISPTNIPTIEQEEITRLKRIVANSPDLLNAGEGDKAPPLHSAAQKGQLHVARFLLEQGAYVNRNWQGGTPLQFAAKAGHKVMCELLLENGAKNEALLAAIENSRNTVALLLLEQGADPNAEEMAWKRNSKTFAKVRPIHLATFGKSSLAVLEALLNAGARPNDVMTAPTDPYSETRTPLSQAIFSGSAERVQLLLKAGADPHQTIRHDRYEDHERTMLQMGLSNLTPKSRPAMIDALLEAGAKWTEGDVQFTLGRASRDPQRLKAALDSGLDPNAGNGHHQYPAVHVAASRYATDALAILLEHGASLDIRNNKAKTALHYLCQFKRDDSLDTIKWLIDHGADINALDKVGNTPLDHALNTWRASTGGVVVRRGGSHDAPVWGRGALLLLKNGANPRIGKSIPSFDHNSPPDPRLFEQFWHAYHLTHNPRRPKALWLSRRIGAANHRATPMCTAILSQDLLPEPGTLQRFLQSALAWTTQLHPEVTVTRLKADGTNETIKVDLTEKPNFELQWGDVVELPYQRTDAPEQTEVYDWINALKGMEIRVRIGEHHLLSNNDRGTYTLSDREMLPHGNVLAVIGVSPYFVESYIVAKVSADGIVAAESRNINGGKRPNMNVVHGSEVQITVVGAKPKLSEEALGNGFHVCGSLEGPFWPVPPRQTWEDDKGIELGLMAPHGLPLHPIDWEKATVRFNKGDDWEEQRILERSSLIPWKQGTVLVLPKADSSGAWSPHPVLRKRIEEQLALTWRLAMLDEPLTTEHYQPPFFTAAKEGDRWVWRDETTPGARPVIPSPIDLYAAHPRYLPSRSTRYERDANETPVLRIFETGTQPTAKRPIARPPTPRASSKDTKRRVILSPGFGG